MLLDEKIKRGMPLNQTELSRCAGYSRSTIAEMVREGLPLYHGKIRLRDFQRWIRQQALKASANIPVDQSLQRVADRLYGQS
jgi:hypothetical protein